MWLVLSILFINIILISVYWYINPVMDDVGKNVLLGVLLSINIIGMIVIFMITPQSQLMSTDIVPVIPQQPTPPPSIPGIISDVISGKPISGTDITSVILDQVKSNPKIIGELVKLAK